MKVVLLLHNVCVGFADCKDQINSMKQFLAATITIATMMLESNQGLF